jgi:hypothetical protein
MPASLMGTPWTYPTPAFGCMASTRLNLLKPVRPPSMSIAVATERPKLWLISFVTKRCVAIRWEWTAIAGPLLAARLRLLARTSNRGWSGKALPWHILDTPTSTFRTNLLLVLPDVACGLARLSGHGTIGGIRGTAGGAENTVWRTITKSDGWWRNMSAVTGTIGRAGARVAFMSFSSCRFS